MKCIDCDDFALTPQSRYCSYHFKKQHGVSYEDVMASQANPAIEAFDGFIRLWVPPAMQGHLLDTDDNDGARVRQAIRDVSVWTDE